jgi:hypothetical protein
MKMNTIPRIDIHFSHYLNGIFEAYVKSIPAYKDWVAPPVEAIESKAEIFKKTWQENGQRILTGICESTGLSFRRNYVPVYVVCGNTRTYSDPIVIKSRFTTEEFIENLTHELIHCLFVDNKDSAFVRNADRLPENDHMALFAAMESVLPGIIDKDTDTKSFPENQRYALAKARVKSAGYLEVLAACRKG